ncbi:polysaccharide biosynthesis/export family protein [Ravibacter arvi]|uniref:Polysaccharide biosynthesis/export family protein n=1 Tax=Ravibacter arvi TaxID=2051041 RepID=A0ABP8M6J4_9BACT
MLAYSLFIASCISQKEVTYFQESPDNPQRGKGMQAYIPLIQSGDVLSVVVGSLNPEANEIFNVRNMATAAHLNYGAAGGAGGRIQPIGYVVDEEGNIDVPLIGKVKVDGLMTDLASKTIRTMLEKYLKEPTVAVRFVGYKISVLGEVKNPSVFVVPEERITLPEALSLAGDLTIYGRRDNVMVIREENGVRTYGKVNLTSRELFDSPYYYLHKNDVIYVEPTKARVTSSDRTLQILPLVLSSLSVIAIILTRVL